MKKTKSILLISLGLLLAIFLSLALYYFLNKDKRDTSSKDIVVNVPDDTIVNNMEDINSTEEESISKEKPILDPNNNIFSKSSFYKSSRLSRYINYSNSNPSLSANIVVNYVNANLDYPFYTNDVAADISKGILILVNKYYYLSSDYVPSDLVNIEAAYSGTSGQNNMLRKVAYEPYVQMCNAAAKDGIVIKNVSAYRSYRTQSWLYNNYAKTDGYALADTYSARPGYSEHQTGLAMDLNMVDDSFVSHAAYAWLKDNSYKYGFILRYPQGKQNITGYKFEPWHYRYVGEDIAIFIYQNDITFDEFYGYYYGE